MGGIGKGTLIKEIDALGGVMGIAAELGGIQCRVLNRSKGPAVRSTRMQADRALYRQAIRTRVEHQENLSVFQQAVDALIIEGEAVKGVITQGGICFLGVWEGLQEILEKTYQVNFCLFCFCSHVYK